jgi:hypothetical protein
LNFEQQVGSGCDASHSVQEVFSFNCSWGHWAVLTEVYYGLPEALKFWDSTSNYDETAFFFSHSVSNYLFHFIFMSY